MVLFNILCKLDLTFEMLMSCLLYHSGGVGRTACFIIIDSMLERVKHENTVDIYGHVTVLRTQRNFMVQTGVSNPDPIINQPPQTL